MIMSNLTYLLPYSSRCQYDALAKIQEERRHWLERESGQAYQNILKGLPNLPQVSCDFSQNSVQIGCREEYPSELLPILEQNLHQFIPWRKGPFDLFGIELDAEWRSDLKWNRLAPHLDPLQGKLVLDIGCNNGYYMFRMSHLKPKLVLGIDPIPHNFFQFQLLQHFAQTPGLHFELFELDHLSLFQELFDTIFFLGILYHHRSPIDQLLSIRKALRPKGQVILETIGIPGEGPVCLFPKKTYAKMRNIWFIPTLSCLINWLEKTHFDDIQVISVTPTTDQEQRLTRWCPPPRQSFMDFMDPQDPQKTLEGYPAPLRFCLSARKKGS